MSVLAALRESDSEDRDAGSSFAGEHAPRNQVRLTCKFRLLAV
jgi:hypothetical protein